jgi:hypothetical protein
MISARWSRTRRPTVVSDFTRWSSNVERERTGRLRQVELERAKGARTSVWSLGFPVRRRGNVGSRVAPWRLACGLASDSRTLGAARNGEGGEARITCSLRLSGEFKWLSQHTFYSSDVSVTRSRLPQEFCNRESFEVDN